MSGNGDAIKVLAPLLRDSEALPLFLLGAGASFRSGVPTAAEAVKQIARQVYSERILNGQRPPERVKPTEWESWLQRFPWFLRGPDRLAENFPLIVDELLKPAEYRKRVLLDLVRPRSSPSSGYQDLSRLVMRGLVGTVLTTNFDTCLIDALREQKPHIRTVAEVNRFSGDYDQFNVFNRCQVVWLHGRADHYSDKNVLGEVSTTDVELVAHLRPLLDGAPVVVIGYRGYEPSVMEGVFAQNKSGRLDFPHGVFWCIRHGETPHPHVQALARRLDKNFRLLRIDGFDEIVGELNHVLAGVDRYADIRPPNPTTSSLSFDETIAEAATLNDLDLDLALSTLRDYCIKLQRSPVTRETLMALMREQGLVAHADGIDKITNAALLLFGKNPQEFFPHSVVSITENNKKRFVVEGNLISQRRILLDKLESGEVNPILKIKKRRQNEERTAYPPRVLVELIVNMLVHRDYSIKEPSNIRIAPESEIAFSNPGGLTQNLAERVTVETDGHFILQERATDPRNPSLCDIFFGINAMERAGTGLMDVSLLMNNAGGASAYYHQDGGAQFEARVYRPRASAGSLTVARFDVPVGVYVFNVLPFSVIPDFVSIVQLSVPWEKRPRDLDLSQCGIFTLHDGKLWSFVPLSILLVQLEGVADVELSRAVPRIEIESMPAQRNVVSWLLRKHWEWYLDSFKEQGLILEDGKKHRAYFASLDRANRTIIWNGPHRRNNRRDVVKRRKEGARAWFENEGFGYEVVEFGGLWCIRIKPFYMFTGFDGQRPLPAFARTGKATSRMKFDRNKNVEADLTFWSAFLGRGHETMNIGDLHVDDLILDASFVSEEIPETGLIKDDPENRNRMSA